MSATGLAAARLIESPAQLAAHTAAPAASVITGVARMRVLRDGIVLPAIVRPGKTIEVKAAAPYRSAVVTKATVKRGSQVGPGKVVTEVDGRPVILLRGRLPAYRNLRIGDNGPDVRELQNALIGLGYSDFDPAGFFGSSTALGLLELYRNLGYSAPTFTPKAKKTAPFPPEPQVYLPMDEVSYLPASSALVVTRPPKAGTELAKGTTIVRLAVGHPYIAGTLTAHQAAEARAGIPARIGLATPARVASGKVTRVSPLGTPAGGGTLDFGVAVASRRPLPQRSIGSTVRLTLLAPVTSGPVLTVPLTALASGPHGSTYVVTVASNGHRKKVAVYTGRQAEGLVAVEGVKAGTLSPGDHVQIGATQ